MFEIQKKENKEDFSFQNDLKAFAGHHIIIDFWGAKELDNIDFIKNVLEKAALDGNGTILNCYFYHFPVGMGVTGIIALAESHISIHTWPEYSLATFDIFMCGEKAQPYKAFQTLKIFFQPKDIEYKEIKRGYDLEKKGKKYE